MSDVFAMKAMIVVEAMLPFALHCCPACCHRLSRMPVSRTWSQSVGGGHLNEKAPTISQR